MDYHNIGFRECATEVARYLVTIEGMDIQDPLRLRLMSHLQCFLTQRELASKQPALGSWGYGTSTQHYSLNTLPLSPSGSPHSSSNLIGHLPLTNQSLTIPTSVHHQPNAHDLNNPYDTSTSCAQSTLAPTLVDSHSRQANQPSSTNVLTPMTTTTSTALGYSHQQYHNLNSFSSGPTSSSSMTHLQNYNQGNSTVNMKPYRPWGAEVAY